MDAVSMGYETIAHGHGSVAIGNRVRCGPSDYTMAIGACSASDTLVNNVENSLMVSFTGAAPTLFVGGANHRVGMGTSSPAAMLDVRGTMNVGEDDTGYDVNFYGAEPGSRMFWDESKMAFRAGRASGTQWDIIGQYSFAAGYNAKATGQYDCALGNGASADGGYSVAVGWACDANGYISAAFGQNSSTFGSTATALGERAHGNGDHSMALGKDVTASADSCIVLGSGQGTSNNLTNSTPNSLIVGFNTTTPTMFVGGTDHLVGVGTTTPSSKLDVDGDTGYEQLRLRDTYTPTGSADANGSTGDVAWDDNYVYVKTSGGWRRAALGSW